MNMTARQNRMRIRDRLIKGTFLNFIAVAFNQGSTLIVNIAIARILMKETFGEYAMVQSTLLTVAGLSQLATGATASKYIAEYRCSDPKRAGRILGLCVVVSAMMACLGTALLIAMSPWLADSMLKAPHLATALIIGSGYLFFSSINGYQTGALSGLEAYGSLAKAGVASGLVAIVTTSLGAWWGGLNGAIAGLSITALFRCALHKIWLTLETRANGITPVFRNSFAQEKAIILKYSVPSALAGYYSTPMIWLANSLLVRQPGGYGEMALYASSTSFRIFVLFIPQVIRTVSISVLNNTKGSGDHKTYKRVLTSNVSIIVLITVLSAALVGFFASTILRIFGKDFVNAETVLQILMFSTVFEGAVIALHQHLQVHEKLWLSLFTINIPREMIFLLLAFLLVPTHRAIGLSSAYAICSVLTLLIVSILVYYHKPGTTGT